MAAKMVGTMVEMKVESKVALTVWMKVEKMVVMKAE